MTTRRVSSSVIVLPTTRIVNGVVYYTLEQSSKPVVRPDGSALVVGDTWINASENSEIYTWDGTYFRGKNQAATQNLFAGANTGFRFQMPQEIILIRKCVQSYFVSTTNDASNYWTWSFGRTASGGTSNFTSGNSASISPASSPNATSTLIVNAVQDHTSNAYITYSGTRTGTPGNITGGISIEYNVVK